MSSLPADRSAVALRSAGSVLICWVFGTMAAVNFKHVSHLMVALACVVSFATPMNLLGDTCRNAFIWASSITVLTPLGLGCCYLCFLIGGLQWNLWVLAVGLGATVLLGVLWSFSAAHLHSPRMMLAGNSATVVICILPLALVLGGLKDHVQLLVSLAGLVTAIFIGALLPLIISHLPYIGAAASASAVPRAAAKKLAALADLCEAVAIYPLPTAAALHRHRECRLRLLSSTQELNAACQSAKMELTEFDLFPEGLAEFQKQTEECRRSLQMKSTMLAAGFSSVTLDLFFRGTPGEQLRATSVWSAHALRSSGSYLLSLAGDQPPEVASAPWLGSSHATAEDCEEAAERCRNAWQTFWDGQMSAAIHPRWRERVEESLLRSMPELGEASGVPLDLFLSGVHHKEATPEAARVAGFDEACRHCASILGLRLGAKASAQIAQMAAKATAKGWRWRIASGSGSFTGCRHWLRVPLHPAAWRCGWAKGGMFACRMATATLLAALIFASVKPYLPPDEDGMWTLITVTMVVTSVAGASIFRGLLRLLGTLLGAALAVGSQLLGGGYLALAPQVFIMAFFNKYFEQELQYAGIVNIVTYLMVLTTLADTNNPEVEDLEEVARLAQRRMLDVMLGVVLSMFANITFFPERGVDELRNRELLSIERTSAALRQSCVAFARLAEGHVDDVADEAWADLRSDVMASVEAMNFAGDGKAGVADLLSDAYLESSWRVDNGTVLGGVLWVPCGGNSFPGQRCLQAVLSISRMLRITYMLTCLCESGFEEGADRPLAHDPMVLQALGSNGEAIGDDLDRAIAVLKPHLEPQRCFQRGSQRDKQKLLEALERLEERLEQLFRGCALSRVKVGGLVMTQHPQQSEGAARSAAAIKLLHGAVQSFIVVCKQLEGCTEDLDHQLKVTLSSDSETSASEEDTFCP